MAQRRDVEFDSDGTRCAAWLYDAEGANEGSVPCIVMGHGFSATRELRLDAYAERFSAAGFACLVFDYRHFGASAGEPRQLLDIDRQLADWTAAVTYARDLSDVDPERIALWGSSFAGGHVVETAAGDPRLAAVISQVPFADGRRLAGGSTKRSLAGLVAAALLDELRGRLGRSPHYIPVLGDPGQTAALTAPGQADAMKALIPEGDTTWVNRYTPRVALRLRGYRPFLKAFQVRCPLLVCVSENDTITLPEPALEGAKAAPRGEVVAYECGHFDLYAGEFFERTISDQIDFLRRTLSGPPVAQRA